MLTPANKMAGVHRNLGVRSAPAIGCANRFGQCCSIDSATCLPNNAMIPEHVRPTSRTKSNCGPYHIHQMKIPIALQLQPDF